MAFRRTCIVAQTMVNCKRHVTQTVRHPPRQKTFTQAAVQKPGEAAVFLLEWRGNVAARAGDASTSACANPVLNTNRSTASQASFFVFFQSINE
jgi:hypothetical protein